MLTSRDRIHQMPPDLYERRKQGRESCESVSDCAEMVYVARAFILAVEVPVEFIREILQWLIEWGAGYLDLYLNR